MQFLAYVLSLPFRGLQTCLGTLASLDSFLKPLRKLRLFLFNGSKSLLRFKVGVGLSLNLVTDVPNSLFGHINLLGNLYKSGKGL